MHMNARIVSSLAVLLGRSAAAACQGKVAPQGAGPNAPDASPDDATTSDTGAVARDASLADTTVAIDATRPRDGGSPDVVAPPLEAGPDGDAVAPTPGWDGGPCSASELATRWATIDREPVVPLVAAAQLPTDWKTMNGITVENAEAINCQCQASATSSAERDTSCSWAIDAEVISTY